MDIAKIVLFAAVIAGVAVLIAFMATYWYIWVIVGVVGFFILKGYHKQKDARNKV